jgi:hypothetical protein
MLACFIWLIVATVFVQVPNLLGVHNQHQDGVLTVFDALKIAALTLPVTFTATTGFTLYYGRGEQYFSYPAMVIYAHTCALAVGILIQVFILKSKETNVVELGGLALSMLGLVVSIYSKHIIRYFSS